MRNKSMSKKSLTLDENTTLLKQVNNNTSNSQKDDHEYQEGTGSDMTIPLQIATANLLLIFNWQSYQHEQDLWPQACL